MRVSLLLCRHTRSGVQDHVEEEVTVRRDGEYVSQKLTESRLGEIATVRSTTTTTTTTATKAEGERRDGFSLATAAQEATETAFLASPSPGRRHCFRRGPTEVPPRRRRAVERANEGRDDDDDGQPDEGAPSSERDEPVCCWRRGVGVLPFCGRFSC